MKMYRMDGGPQKALPLVTRTDKKFLTKSMLLVYMHSLNLSTRRIAKLIKRPYRTVQGWISPQKPEGAYIPITILEWRKILNLEFIKNAVESEMIDDQEVRVKAKIFVNRWAGKPAQ